MLLCDESGSRTFTLVDHRPTSTSSSSYQSYQNAGGSNGYHSSSGSGSGLPSNSLYWILPVSAAAVWTLTLAFLMIDWLGKHRPRLPLMTLSQDLPYISDIAAGRFKNVFIGGNILFTGLWIGTLAVEHDLRTRGILPSDTSHLQSLLSGLGILLAFIGCIGLIMLAVLDVENNRVAHLGFLGVFVLGSLGGLALITAHFWLLSLSYPKNELLHISAMLKLVLVSIGGAMALGFGVANVANRRTNWSSILEWMVALFFILFVLSFTVDLFPTKRPSRHRSS